MSDPNLSVIEVPVKIPTVPRIPVEIPIVSRIPVEIPIVPRFSRHLPLDTRLFHQKFSLNFSVHKKRDSTSIPITVSTLHSNKHQTREKNLVINFVAMSKHRH